MVVLYPLTKKFSEFYAVIIVCMKKKRTFANGIINAICGDCIDASSALGFYKGCVYDEQYNF